MGKVDGIRDGMAMNPTPDRFYADGDEIALLVKNGVCFWHKVISDNAAKKLRDWLCELYGKPGE